MRGRGARLLVFVLLAVGCNNTSTHAARRTKLATEKQKPPLAKELQTKETPSSSACPAPARLCQTQDFARAHRRERQPQGEWIQLRGGARAYLALPATRLPPMPGVLLLHSARGLTRNVELWSERLAEFGYAALAVDLYQGETADSDAAATALRDRANGRAAEVQETIAAGFERLTLDDRVRSQRRALVGWSWGGGWATYMATQLDGLRAVVSFGGNAVVSEEMVKQVKAPVLLLRGRADVKFTAEKPPTIQAIFGRRSKPLEFLEVAGGHVFSDPDRPDFSAAGDEEALVGVRGFLRMHLKRVGSL